MAQTYTTLGSLTSATSGSWVAVPKNAPGDALVTIAATGVTTGAVVSIEARNAGAPGVSGVPGVTPTREVYRATIAANKILAFSLGDVLQNAVEPDDVRITVVSRTDGTYVGQIVTGAP